MTILVTGASGFIGRATVQALAARGQQVVRGLREADTRTPEERVVGSINARTDWRAALQGISCVVHLAARVHVLRETAADPDRAFEEVNVEGTRRLAESAVAAGVKRLVFVSTAGVHGSSSSHPLQEGDPLNPETPYTRSKARAEQVLRELARDRLELVFIRPPMVYGVGAPGNFCRLVSLVRSGVPLPFASIHNQRSMLAVRNLADALALACVAPEAAGETFLVADDEAFSVGQLVNAIGAGLGFRPWLVPFPVSILGAMAAAAGRTGEFRQLTGNLTVSHAHITERLGWKPPWRAPDEIMAAAAACN